MFEVRHIARSEIGEPLVDTGNAGLVEHAETEACRFPFVLHDRRQKVFADGRLMRLADLEGARVHVPLDGVAEQVRQQEESQLGTHRVVDVDLGAIQIAGQRVGDVPGHDSPELF